MGANDGIRRGDRADTGALEARPKRTVGAGGSGVSAGHGGATGHATFDPSSMGGDETSTPVGGSTTDLEDLEDAGLRVVDAGQAGLTGVDSPADPATETGGTRSAESGSWSATGEATDTESTLAGGRPVGPGVSGGKPDRAQEDSADTKKKR